MSSKPRKHTKAHKRLGRRIADFLAGPKSNYRQEQRWEQGGFHQPGSNKK